jgi:PAS domain S-box-containing protein
MALRLRAAGRQVAVLTATALAIVVLGWFIARDVRATAEDTSKLYRRLSNALDLIDNLQFQTQEVRRILLYALHTTDANRQLEYAEQSRKADSVVQRLLSQSTDLLSVDLLSRHAREEIQDVERAWREYLVVRDEVIGLILEGSLSEGVALDENRGTSLFNQVRRALASLKAHYETDAELQVAAARARGIRALARLVALVACALIAAVIGVNLVKRRTAAEALARSEAHRGAILQAVPHPILSTDEAGRIIELNHAAEREFGTTRDRALGKIVGDVILEPSAREAVPRALLRPDVRDGVVSRVVTVGRRYDGTTFPMELAASSRGDGRERIWTIHVADLTQQQMVHDALRQARDAAESATRAKSEFLATMTHELRTPLTGVIGIADLLQTAALPPHQQDLARMLRSSAAALLGLVSDVLDYSRIEAGLTQLVPVSFSPRRCAEEAIDTIAETASRKGLHVERHFDADVPAAVMADQDRVRQVLLNLLSNAIKFTDRGYVALAMRAASQPGGWRITATVSDTGRGIAREDHHKLFQRFGMVGANPESGAGLGLAISERLSRLLGGSLNIDSDAGRGTVATFEFEAGETTAVALPPPDRIVLDVAPEAGSLAVLLVEDNDANRRVVRLMLEELGFVPDEAADGDDAVARARARPYDVILMDLQMPGIDGFEAARRIRAEGTGHPRIVALTANVIAGEEQRCRAAGMDGYLPKPLRLETLADALKLHGPPVH